MLGLLIFLMMRKHFCLSLSLNKQKERRKERKKINLFNIPYDIINPALHKNLEIWGNFQKLKLSSFT